MQPELEGTTFEGPWVRPSNKDEVLASFSNWEPAMKDLLGVNVSHTQLIRSLIDIGSCPVFR